MQQHTSHEFKNNDDFKNQKRSVHCIVFISIFILICSYIGQALFSFFYTSFLKKTITIIYSKKETEFNFLEALKKEAKRQDILYFVSLVSYFYHFHFTYGQYKLNEQLSLYQILRKLKIGDTQLFKICLVEGSTVHQIINSLNQKDFLVGSIESIPKEGELMPDTYFFKYGELRKNIINRSKVEMVRFLKKNVNIKDPLKVNEILTMASIIEKESSLATERHLISGIFYNRIKKKMRLQSDPTVIYALTDGKSDFKRQLLKKDLKIESPYNTYKNKGLPPGPICCPSRASILAALQPQKTLHYYFVANGNGGHQFAQTLEEHNKNRQKWKSMKKQNALKQNFLKQNSQKK